MDSSHVALVSMLLKADGFEPFRCDRNIALGINLNSLAKVLRCAANEDVITIKADDMPDTLNLVFESPTNDRISEYEIKLMDIDQEHLGIPETEYDASITMPTLEFQRICRDLLTLSESVEIDASKEGVKFACKGEIGQGSVMVKQAQNFDDPTKSTSIQLSEPVKLSFSLKYLSNFTKATALATSVKLGMSKEQPLLVEYQMENGHVRFYLAPKLTEGDDQDGDAIDEDE